MGSYTVVAAADYRNEGWSLGGGVVDLTQAWNNDNDTNYASCPSNRGRAAVRFPIDISTSAIPAGAQITSVTVKIRVRKTVSDSKSVTVNVICLEDTSRYFSRTLYPTTSFADYEVGTYTVDALGKSWNRERLNKLAIQVFSYSVPPNDGVRVAKLYAVVNYKSGPSVRVNAPTGSVDSPAPLMSWTYEQEDGDLQKSAQYKIFTAARVGETEFNADTSTPVYSGTVEGDVTEFRIPTALTANTYYVYVRVTSVHDATSRWASRSFTLTGASPGVPGGGVGGIGTGGGGGFERVIADAETSNCFLTLRDGSNLLSVQQASFETSNDSLGYVPDNCALLHDTEIFYQGIGSMRLTAASGGDMSAATSFIEVPAETDVTGTFQVLAGDTGRSVKLRLEFYDEQFDVLPAQTVTASVTDSDSTWTEVRVQGRTPYVEDTALYCRLWAIFEDVVEDEFHNIDLAGLILGRDAVWSHGGHASRNVLSSVASDADEPVGDEPWQEGNIASSVERVASQGIGSEGQKMYAMTYDGTAPSISYVSTGTAFASSDESPGYTLNKPASVQDGDVYVAYMITNALPTLDGSGIETPLGWRLVNVTSAGTGSTRNTMYVMVRDALASDPSTWVGNLASSATTRKRAVVVCYRGAAPAADQFPVESAKAAVSSSNVVETPTLSNADANSWRLSAVAIKETSSGTGSFTASTTPPASVPPISYVGKGSNWWYGGSLGSFTINRPSNVQEDDLMIAFGSFSGTATPTAPTGWRQIRRQVRTNGNGDDHSGTVTFVVWVRTATSSEPSSWGSSYSGTGTPLMTQAVAYRNADIADNQFIDESVSTAGGNSVGTGTVTNNDSKAWRISAFTFTTNFGERTSSNESVERSDTRSDLGAHPDVQIGIYDSNGSVSTGSHSRWGSVTGYYSSWAGVGWIGLIKPATAVSPGSPESERSDGGVTNGSVAAMRLAVYDSNGSASTGSRAVYGNYTPDGDDTLSAVGWMGFLVPDTPVTSGEVAAELVAPVDISQVHDAVLERAGGKVTFQAAFLGSTSGQSYLRLFFYNATELLATRTAQGRSFDDSRWVKSVATFDIPEGTTRIGCGVTATDREVGDEVYFDRVSLAFGEGEVWRRGTGRAEHPIFGLPVIEYAEDDGSGYGDWRPLFGSDKALLRYDQLTGLVTYIDQTLTPLASRKYRAKTVTYGLAGDQFASGYGDESEEISLVAQHWWIKDPTVPESAIQVKVKSEAFGVTTASTAAVFQPLGADRPVVITEGYKGDTFSITVICDRFQYVAIRQLLNSRKTLFLQSNLDNAWWVRPIGDIGAETQETGKRREDPLRFVELTFTEVDPIE